MRREWFLRLEASAGFVVQEEEIMKRHLPTGLKIIILLTKVYYIKEKLFVVNSLYVPRCRGQILSTLSVWPLSGHTSFSLL